MNNNIGNLIVMSKYWTDSIKDIINISAYDITDEYSLLNFKFNNKNYTLIHLTIPEYGFHITLAEDGYLQFHRRKNNKWGTRVSYGNINPKLTTHEFYLDGSMPWYIIPIIDYERNILTINMYRYEVGQDNPTHYFVNHFLDFRNKNIDPYIEPVKLKPEFKYENINTIDPSAIQYNTDITAEQLYERVEQIHDEYLKSYGIKFEKLDKPIKIDGTFCINNLSSENPGYVFIRDAEDPEIREMLMKLFEMFPYNPNEE